MIVRDIFMYTLIINWLIGYFIVAYLVTRDKTVFRSLTILTFIFGLYGFVIYNTNNI